MDEALRLKTSAEGTFAVRLAESSRRELFRAEGATSPEAWVAERFGMSVASARAPSRVAERTRDLPHLVGSLCRATSPSTRCGRWSRWPPPGPTRSCASWRRRTRFVSWPMSPGRPPTEPDLRGSLAVGARTPLSALQRPAPHDVAAAAGRGLRADPGLCRLLGRHGPPRRGDPARPAALRRIPAGWWARPVPAGPPRPPRSSSSPTSPSTTLVEGAAAGRPGRRARARRPDRRRDGHAPRCDATMVVAVDDDRATPCTRAGPGASPPERNAERSSAAIDTAASRAVRTSRSRTCTTLCRGNRAAGRTSRTWCSCVVIITAWCTERAGPCRATPTRSSPLSVRRAESWSRARCPSGPG